MRIISCAVAVAWICVSGCRPMTAEPAADDATFDAACEEPRPEACTKEYRPVCGMRDTGIRCVTTPCDSTEWRTYGNACMACSDKEVYGYKAGQCPE